MTKLKINREEFRAWLKAMPDNKVVGYANSSTKDPIARFLRTKKGIRSKFEVLGNSVVFFNKYDYKEYTLPQWAQRFIDIIDDHGVDKPVTAAEARKAANR